MKHILLALALGTTIVISLTACIHGGRAKNTQFNSLITENGLKLFEFSFPGPKAQPITLQSKQQAPKAWAEKRVISYLDDALAKNKFCRKGYLILGRYAGETTRKLRGECKETANEEDVKRFPNSISRW